MTVRRRIPNEAAARNIRELRDKCIGPAVKSAQVGNGKFGPSPATFNGVGRIPPGWSGHMGEIEEYNDTEDDNSSTGWRVDFPADMQAQLDDNDMLTNSERRQLQNALDDSEEEPEHVEGQAPPHRPKPRPRGWQRKEMNNG